MPDPVSAPDPQSMRISDAERDQVADVLREAAAEGRIDFAELDERLHGVFSARTYAELPPLVSDLPGVRVPSPIPQTTPARGPDADGAALERFDASTAVMGSQERVGSWEVGPQHRAVAMMGEVVIDLRDARFGQPETVIAATAVMGSVTVIVNARTRVKVEGSGVLGEFTQRRDRVKPDIGLDSPLVRVRGTAVMGSVVVVRRAQHGDEGWRGWLSR